MNLISRQVSTLSAYLVVGTITTLCISQNPANATILIGNTQGNSIIRFDEQTGTFLGDFTTSNISALRDPDDLTFGPDGNLYVSVGGSSVLNLFNPSYPTDSAVLRFSPSGEFLGVAATGNGLTRPYGNAFGPDGTLYISSFRTNQILKFNPNTGAFLGVFASDNNNGRGSLNGLNGPNDLLFGPDGSLYVTTQGSANTADGDLSYPYESQVLRYSPEQVAGVEPTTNPSVFISQPTPLPESFGFVSLLGLTLAPNNDILVSDFAGGIRRYNSSGVLLETISTNYTGTNPSSNFIGNLTFGSGNFKNNLYVAGFDFTNNNRGSILAFNGATGNANSFTGIQYSNGSLVRSIGIAAVPVPENSSLLGLAGIGILYLASASKKLKLTSKKKFS
ncbi:MAG TPA: PEP-CTERM sorting domain-containing protein [Nostocaceae cyanobacterium]|nr:PEP-CTERM sorting domain-containing protein [Nostocaceae cyanobacterium]